MSPSFYLPCINLTIIFSNNGFCKILRNVIREVRSDRFSHINFCNNAIGHNIFSSLTSELQRITCTKSSV